MDVIEIAIEEIEVDERFRKDMGNMGALEASIHETDLLEPIGVTLNATGSLWRYKLAYGARRLEACENLGWESIPCVVVNPESALIAQYAENEFRKDFTASERAAIGKAIEGELGDRRGGDRSKPAIAGNAPKGESVDIAASRAGFHSAESYQRAKTVVDRGAPELIAAMDSGDVSIDAAAKIASQPKADQVRILSMPKDQQHETVRQIRKTRADREADERRARDLRLFRGLYDAVKFIATFYEDPRETWDGMWRVSAYDFAGHLDKALEYLPRLKKAHPNEPKRPIKVS